MPGHNAADDDDDQQQAGDGVHEVLEENGSRDLTSSGIVVLLCDDIRHHHTGQCPHQAGDVARHDHAHHRAASQHRIDDQDAGRRNDQTGRCRSDVDGSGKLFIVAFLLLHGDQNAADGNGSCNGGTGQRAEQRVAQNVGVRQTTGDAADQNFCEIDQFLCNAAGVHQNTAEDVERDSQQREAVNTAHHALAGNEGAQIQRQGGGHGHDRRNDDTDRDRDAQRQQQRKRADQEQTDLKSTHFRFVLLFYASLADSALGPCFISRRSSPMKMSA